MKKRLKYFFHRPDLKIICFFLLFSAFFILLGLEIMLVFYLPNFRPIVENSQQLGFQLKPNSSAADYSTIIAEHRIVNYYIGDHGERTRELGQKQKQEGPLILCLGDSHTFGQGVEYEETYPALLSNAIGRPSTIMNFGVPAYNGHQVCKSSLEKVAKHNPDLVIMQFCGNDDEPPIPFGKLRSHTILASTQSGVLFYLTYKMLSYLIHDPPNKTTASTIPETLVRLKKKNIPVILVIYSKPPSMNKMLRRKEFKDHALSIVDIGYLYQPSNVLESSSHFNKKGNRLIAYKLANVIHSHHLLD